MDFNASGLDDLKPRKKKLSHLWNGSWGGKEAK
jgi:hypothetical protein